MNQMADSSEKTQKVYGKYIKELPQVTELNETDDFIVEDSIPVTNRAKLGILFDAIKKRIASSWSFSELGNKTIVEYITETNKNLTDKLDKDYTLAYGTWYANGVVIPLKDSYLNYRDIIIRTGWNSQNGGIRDHRLSINGNGTILYQAIPLYQAAKYIGVLVVEFNPATPKQIKIVQSTGITSNSASSGIRNVMGRTKLS